MGCKTLGYCEREGRDRDEEHRRYAEFLTREGYDVISVEDGVARVRSDAGGVVKREKADPEELFVVNAVTRRLIAESLSDVTAEPVAADDPRLTAEVCREYAAALGEINLEDEEGRNDEELESLLVATARKAGIRV